jgi:hypothetical protein
MYRFQISIRSCLFVVALVAALFAANHRVDSSVGFLEAHLVEFVSPFIVTDAVSNGLAISSDAAIEDEDPIESDDQFPVMSNPEIQVENSMMDIFLLRRTVAVGYDIDVFGIQFGQTVPRFRCRDRFRVSLMGTKRLSHERTSKRSRWPSPRPIKMRSGDTLRLTTTTTVLNGRQ